MQEERKITKAVITAAGYGTRFLPATKSVPKEMLPIIDTPIIQYIVEEIVASGINDIIIVTRHGNDAIEEHFDSLVHLEEHLEKAGKIEKLEEIREALKMANIAFVRQKKDLPYGNGSPVLAAKPFIGDANFLLAFGDDLTLPDIGGKPIFKQIVDKFEQNECEAIVAVQKMPKEELSRYGTVKLKEGSADELEKQIEKPKPGEEPSDLAVFGRYALSPRFFDYLSAEKTGKDDELWVTDAIDDLAHDYRVLIHEITGKWYTTGDPIRYLKATFEFAMRRDDLKDEYIHFLRERAASM